MGELGDLLREARESRGLSLERVEEATRIRRVFLEALEEERFDALPGEVYVRGFLRNYARFLGLDPEELLTAYRSAMGTVALPNVPIVLDEPLMRRAGSHIAASIFLAIMAVLLLALAGWYIYRRFYLGLDPWPFLITWPVFPAAVTRMSPDSTVWRPARVALPTSKMYLLPTSTVYILPTFRTRVLPTSTKQVVRASTRPVLPTSTMHVRVIRAAPVGSPSSQSTPTQRPTQASSPSSTSTFTPTATRVSGVRVEIEVLARTYVDVKVDGEQVLVRILEAGEDQVWEAERRVSMRIGNAAGLRLVVNGVRVGPLGRHGEVVGVEYTLDNLPRG